jgi:hypothetical protein
MKRYSVAGLLSVQFWTVIKTHHGGTEARSHTEMQNDLTRKIKTQNLTTKGHEGMPGSSQNL